MKVGSSFTDDKEDGVFFLRYLMLYLRGLLWSDLNSIIS